MTVPFMYNFQCLSNGNKFPTVFVKFNLHIPLSSLGYFSKKKRKSKIFGFKNMMERGIEKFVTFVMHLKYKKTYVARQPKKWPY